MLASFKLVASYDGSGGPWKECIISEMEYGRMHMDGGKIHFCAKMWVVASEVPENDPLMYSKEECVNQYVKAVWDDVNYWQRLYAVDQRDPIECMSGLAFSILSMLDGSRVDIPGVHMIPMSTDDDVEYLQHNGRRYYNPVLSNRFEGDVGGYLHELWHSSGKDLCEAGLLEDVRNAERIKFLKDAILDPDTSDATLAAFRQELKWLLSNSHPIVEKGHDG